MSPIEPELPEVSEEIHLPGPSTEPVLIAVGITIALIGVTFHIVAVVLGTALVLWQSIKWIRETREEIRALPQDHDH